MKLLEENGYDVEDDEYPDSLESGTDFHGGNNYLFDNQRFLRGSSHRSRSWGTCSLSIFRNRYRKHFIKTFIGERGEIFKGITKTVGSLKNGKKCCWIIYRYNIQLLIHILIQKSNLNFLAVVNQGTVLTKISKWI